MLLGKFINQEITLINSFETDLNLEPCEHHYLTCI